MSALEPQGSSQPTLNQAYETAGNPADQKPTEEAAAQKQESQNKGSSSADETVPQTQSQGVEDATPSSLARGIHGAPPGEEADGKTSEDVGRNKELDGEQMRAPGEGEIATAVDEKPGATGGEHDMASDLDRKKAEQAPAREAKKEERKENVDVAGILANRGGPADSSGVHT